VARLRAATLPFFCFPMVVEKKKKNPGKPINQLMADGIHTFRQSLSHTCGYV
jgi:hypothetical protein